MTPAPPPPSSQPSPSHSATPRTRTAAWKLPALAACAGGLAILLAAIVHASLAEDVLTGLRRVLADRWGVATLLDLLVGLALVAAWIVAVETRRWLAALLVLLLALLGNVTTLAYLMARIAGATEPRDIILPAQGPSREPRGTP